MSPQPPLSMILFKIIWGALFISQLFYLGVLQFVIQTNTEDILEVNQSMVMMMTSLAIIIFCLAILVPRVLLKLAKQQEGIGPMLPKPEFPKMLSVSFAPFIVRLAMFEGVAICGFALAFIHKEMQFFLPFLGVSMVAFLINFPTEEKIKAQC